MGPTCFSTASNFRWLRGESLVKHYKVPEAQRFSVQFCEKCGSGLPRHGAGAPVTLVPAGTLDTRHRYETDGADLCGIEGAVVGFV